MLARRDSAHNVAACLPRLLLAIRLPPIAADRRLPPLPLPSFRLMPLASNFLLQRAAASVSHYWRLRISSPRHITTGHRERAPRRTT